MNKEDEIPLLPLGTELEVSDEKRKGKSNAKAVQVFDLEGNLIETYKSGILAAQALGILQGDISLCCRGLKPSVNGYKFKFVGDYDDINLDSTKLKRGYAIETVVEGSSTKSNIDIDKPEIMTRSSRTSRGEYGMDREMQAYSNSALSTSQIQVS